MRDANEQIEIVGAGHVAEGQKLAMGIVAGAALGAALGLLLAPRKGSELRGQIKVQASRAANSASNGYHAVTDTAGAWAHRCHDAYDTSRHKVVDAYHGTTRYLGEVSDAVTMKPRQQPEGTAQRIAITQPQSPADRRRALDAGLSHRPARASIRTSDRRRGRLTAAPGHHRRASPSFGRSGYPAGVTYGPAHDAGPC